MADTPSTFSLVPQTLLPSASPLLSPVAPATATAAKRRLLLQPLQLLALAEGACFVVTVTNPACILSPFSFYLRSLRVFLMRGKRWGKHASISSDRAHSSVIVCVQDTQQLIDEEQDDGEHCGAQELPASPPVPIPSNGTTTSLAQACSCPAQSHFASW